MTINCPKCGAPCTLSENPNPRTGRSFLIDSNTERPHICTVQNVGGNLALPPKRGRFDPLKQWYPADLFITNNKGEKERNPAWHHDNGFFVWKRLGKNGGPRP